MRSLLLTLAWTVLMPCAAPAADATDAAAKLTEKLRAARELLPVNEAEEIRVGRQVAANLLAAAPPVKDDGLQRYINQVGRWVALQGERPGLPWRFAVVESPDVNAFAAPGGYVFVTRGLYARLRDESELAGVLAHEVAHVLRRHHLDLMRKTALIARGSAALQKKLEGDQLVNKLVGNGAEIFARRLDQDAEYEADRMGVVLAARAGYEPYGLPSVLQTLDAINPASSSVALLFKTHPRPADRLNALTRALQPAPAGFDSGGTGGALYRLR